MSELDQQPDPVVSDVGDPAGGDTVGVDLFGAPVLAPVERVARSGMAQHESQSSQTDTWLTPRFVLDALGEFDLDPCAAPDPKPWPTARTHYTWPGQDGLELPWFGRVWVNPPYSDAGTWMGRLAEHGRGTALIFARTETAWFGRHVWGRASALLFLTPRLSFCRADGSPGGSNAGAPSVLVTYGAEDAQALAECGLTGAFVPGGWDWNPPEGRGQGWLF